MRRRATQPSSRSGVVRPCWTVAAICVALARPRLSLLPTARFQGNVTRCQACHADAKNFDVNGVQTEVKAMFDELRTIFVTKGMLDKDTDLWVTSADAPASYPEAVTQAMWNFKVVEYDQSMGVHNPEYTKALLQQGLDAMK